jgi:hypothetical protein
MYNSYRIPKSVLIRNLVSNLSGWFFNLSLVSMLQKNV